MLFLTEKEIRNQRAKEYYQKNKDEIKQRNNERSKKYYHEHKHEILSRLQDETNKKRLQEYNKEYYQRNKDKILEGINNTNYCVDNVNNYEKNTDAVYLLLFISSYLFSRD